MSGYRGITPGMAGGYGLGAAMWFGPGPAPYGWVAIGGDAGAAIFGSAAAGGSGIYSGLGLGLRRVEDDADRLAA